MGLDSFGRNYIFLENRMVASRRDILERKNMKRLGYRIDQREGVLAPIPTYSELRLEYEGKRIKLGRPINGYGGRGKNMNKHQWVGVYVYLQSEQTL